MLFIRVLEGMSGEALLTGLTLVPWHRLVIILSFIITLFNKESPLKHLTPWTKLGFNKHEPKYNILHYAIQ